MRLRDAAGMVNLWITRYMGEMVGCLTHRDEMCDTGDVGKIREKVLGAHACLYMWESASGSEAVGGNI